VVVVSVVFAAVGHVGWLPLPSPCFPSLTVFLYVCDSVGWLVLVVIGWLGCFERLFLGLLGGLAVLGLSDAHPVLLGWQAVAIQLCRTGWASVSSYGTERVSEVL